MKKCWSCGAKNRDQFLFCVRCSASLISKGPASVAFPKIGKLGIAAVGTTVLLISAFAFRGLATRGESMPSLLSTNEEARLPAPDLETKVGVDTEDIDNVEKATELNRGALAAFRAGQYQEALELFLELAELSPTNATAHFHAAICSERLGNGQEAIDRLKRVVELQPTHEEAIQRLIPMLIRAGDLEEAESLQARLVERNPFQTKPLIELGIIHRQRGDLDRAIEEHQRAVEMDSSNQRALLELANSLNEAGRHEEARDVCQRVIALDAGNPSAHAGLGNSLLLAKRYAEALGPLKEGVRLAPEQAEVRLQLAMAFENLNRIEDSLREYDAFLRLTKDRQMAAKVERLVKRAKAALAEREAAR